MNVFPVLKTGAVMQYPAERWASYSTQTVRFLDGTEQRFGDYSTPLHRWVIRLVALDETEMHLVHLGLIQGDQANHPTVERRRVVAKSLLGPIQEPDRLRRIARPSLGRILHHGTGLQNGKYIHGLQIRHDVV